MDNIISTLTKAISLAVIAVVAKEMTKAIELDWSKKQHESYFTPVNGNPYINYDDYDESNYYG